jgi:hypothetical protein
MPKKPTDYSKTIIYKIQHIDNPELLYVGSTTDFTKRKYQHKSDCNNPNRNKYNMKLYQMIRENGNWDMFNMVIVKEYPCENRRQAECEEDRCIREMKATLNSIRAFITPEEQIEIRRQWRLENKDKIKEYNLEHKEQRKQYYIENKDKIVEQNKQYYTENKDKKLEQYKQYYTENKDKILEQRKQYYTENKDKITERTKQYYLENEDKLTERTKQYYLENKDKLTEYNKQWRLEHKDKITERTKQYYLENKDKIVEQNKQKITCECGCVIRRDGVAEHKRSKKHQDLLNKHLV